MSEERRRRRGGGEEEEKRRRRGGSVTIHDTLEGRFSTFENVTRHPSHGGKRPEREQRVRRAEKDHQLTQQSVH
jgi:hypothetical protein